MVEQGGRYGRARRSQALGGLDPRGRRDPATASRESDVAEPLYYDMLGRLALRPSRAQGALSPLSTSSLKATIYETRRDTLEWHPHTSAEGVTAGSIVYEDLGAGPGDIIYSRWNVPDGLVSSRGMTLYIGVHDDATTTSLTVDVDVTTIAEGGDVTATTGSTLTESVSVSSTNTRFLLEYQLPVQDYKFEGNEIVAIKVDATSSSTSMQMHELSLEYDVALEVDLGAALAPFIASYNNLLLTLRRGGLLEK